MITIHFNEHSYPRLIECSPDTPVFVYEKTVTTSVTQKRTTLNAGIIHLYPGVVMRLSQYFLEAAHSSHILQDNQESFDSQVSEIVILLTNNKMPCHRIPHLDLIPLMKRPLVATKPHTFCLHNHQL